MTASEIICQYVNEDVHTLATKNGWYGSYDKRWLLQQIQARQKAKSKLPSWYGNFDLLFPPPLSVEQASSEVTAAYKASLLSGNSLVDVTGGMGVDSSLFARHFQRVYYSEMQPDVVAAARHNFAALKLDNVEVIENPSGDIATLPAADCVFLDPSRRAEGRRVFLLEDCSPNLRQWLPYLTPKYPTVLVKLSPMYDLTAAVRELPGISAIHVVAVGNEVKELLLLFAATATAPTLTCVQLGRTGVERAVSFAYSERNRAIEHATEVQRYLYEPHATLLKTDLMNAEAARCHLRKLHPHSHLYTSSELATDFFGRIFEVESSFRMGKTELKNGLSGLTHANITTRNFPLKEADLRRKLRLEEGGEHTLFGTTITNGQHVIIRAKKSF